MQANQNFILQIIINCIYKLAVKRQKISLDSEEKEILRILVNAQLLIFYKNSKHNNSF